MPATKGTRQITREIVDVELTPEEQMQEEARQEQAEDTELEEPLDCYLPWSPYERFRLPGTTDMVRFMAGRFPVRTVKQRDAVFAIIRSYLGSSPRAEADFCGHDRKSPYVCRNCGFTSFNEASTDVHRDLGF